MSRVGKKPIPLPKGVTVRVQDGLATCTGPKGELTQLVPAEMTYTIAGDALTIERPSESRTHRARHGLARALLANMVTGVTHGFTRTLEIQGVGYRAQVQGTTLQLNVGYSHPVAIEAPEGIAFAVDRNVILTVSGIDKQLVGETAARIRRVRPPEPYKGKGIRYEGETVRLKAGKAGP